MVIEFGRPMPESSTKISKFHALTNSQHKFHKARIENWLPIRFELGSPWLIIDSHNHRLGNCWVGVPPLRTRSSTNNGGNLKKIYITIQKVLEQPGDISFPWNCASVLKFHYHHQDWHKPPIEQKANNVGLIIYTNSTWTKLRYLTHDKTKRKLPNHWGSTRKSWIHLSPSFPC